MMNHSGFNGKVFVLGAAVALLGAAIFGGRFSQPMSAQTHRGLRSPDVLFINPPTIAAPRGYSHVVDVRHGRMVFIAGQVALDREGNLVGADDLKAQTEQVFRNLSVALESVGGSFKDLVKLNWYLTDASQIAVVREVRDRYVNVKSPPASTAVVVSRLARADWLVEVEAVAVLPQEARMIPAR
jgi:2-iminobutanoate/2-iminopropanoate deaminase